MDKLERIIEHARRLSLRDRRKLIAALIESRTNGKPASRPRKRAVTGRAGRMAALDAFLALAGAAHSDYTDVSSNKYKHLAEIYYDNHKRS